jgi:hypothetical protein
VNSELSIVHSLLLSRVTTAEECDATGDDSSMKAGNINIFNFLLLNKQQVGLIFVVYRAIFVNPVK